MFQSESDGAFAAQIVECIVAASVDVAFNYTFKWVELWFDNTPVPINDFATIFSKMNTTEVLTSAGIACATTVIPWPSNKAKVVAALTAAFGAGAVAIAGDVELQYSSIQKKYPQLSFIDIMSQISWTQALTKGGVQALIAGTATGVVFYAATHPKFINFAVKLKKIGYLQLSARLEKAGLNRASIDAFCEKFAVNKVAGEANILDDVVLITSSNVSKQAKIDKIAEWLKGMGKKNSEINDIIKSKIDLSSGVNVIELNKGDKVFRFEKITGAIESEKHFFTTADAADAGVKSVGFSDASGYKLVTYEVIENTQVLKTKMNTNYIQYITDKLQNNIKIISTETAH